MFNKSWEPFGLFGMDLIIEEPKLIPKLKLSDNAPVSDAFRAEMNQWLLDMFGTRDVSLIPKGTAYMFGNIIMMRPEMAAMFSNATA